MIRVISGNLVLAVRLSPPLSSLSSREVENPAAIPGPEIVTHLRRKGSSRMNRITSSPSKLALAGVALLALQGFTLQKAYAHYPIISATASCSNGSAVISYTASSWDQNPADPGGTNPEIDIYFNGVKVDMGAFAANSNPPDQFSNTLPAPAATNNVSVQAVAAQPWGDLWPAGDSSNIVSLTIPSNCAPGTGRFTGGGKQVTVGGVAVTKGFEVDCDLHQPSNNLEINWQGHQFHMTVFTSAVCTLTGNPNPPPAPVNNIVGTGTGRYDGTYGYTVVFQLIDNGEPGTNDMAAFMVYETANPSNVVLNVPLEVISGGNVQAHVDQK